MERQNVRVRGPGEAGGVLGMLVAGMYLFTLLSFTALGKLLML